MADRASVRPPTWMSRAEKREFRAFLAALPECSGGVPATKVDALTDYVAARARLTVLRGMWAKLTRKTETYASDEKHAMALARQIDATTVLSHRIGRELGLLDPERGA